MCQCCKHSKRQILVFGGNSKKSPNNSDVSFAKLKKYAFELPEIRAE